MHPKVSVIIPVKDRIELLADCLRNVLTQSLMPHEVIVVDDGSARSAADGIRERNIISPILRFVRLEANRGANYARNVGVSLATGDYVAFQDSDDIWLPNKLEVQLQAVVGARRDHAFVYCPLERHLADGRVARFPREGFLPTGLEVIKELRRGNFISTQTVLASRALLLAHKFDESLPRLQDWEAWIRISADADILATEAPLVISRESPDSISVDSSRYATALPAILQKHLRYFQSDKEALAHWARAAMAFGLNRRRIAEAVKWGSLMLRADLSGSRSILRGRLPRIREHAEVPESGQTTKARSRR